jgi:hypothetical protein
MNHECPIPACTVMVKPGIFMCARHWRMVPKPLQVAIYESYRATGNGLSQNHREAVRVVLRSEGRRASVLLPPGTKALTIWQPWASLIMMGAKPYEFRRWNFADKPHLAGLIGSRIVIHAGARAPRLSELTDILDRISDGESALDAAIVLPFIGRLRSELASTKTCASAPLAYALGTAVLGEPKNVLALFANADSDRLDEHMYGWPLSAIEPFPEPIPAAGAQGFWNWS